MSRYGFLRVRDVELVPKSGAIIVTMTRHTAQPIKEGIREVHGPAVLKRCRFVSINRRGQEQKLEGMRGPVLLAHCFRLFAPVDLVARTTAIACGVIVAGRMANAKASQS